MVTTMTLAYLFWHWPRERDGYEDGLIAFHHRLQAAGVPGCTGSATYRVAGLPWLNGRDAYEDWYLVDGFADLDTLNRAAVSPTLRDAHDRPAMGVGGGMGGLYALTAGTADLDAPVASWFSKPLGVPYSDFIAGLPVTAGLFQRQLVLGPGLEFCALGDVPDSLTVKRVRLA
jgi:hypothetical protein